MGWVGVTYFFAVPGSAMRRWAAAKMPVGVTEAIAV
jgi:hypothetical protein